MEKFTYLGSSVSLTENDINIWLAKAWTVIDGLSVMWKSDLADKIKYFFQAAVVSILLIWMHHKDANKAFREKARRQLHKNAWALLNKSWRQHPTKLQLYEHLSPIMKSIQVWRTRHAGHHWVSKDELISDVLRWTPSHGRAKVRRPARTYLLKLCADMACGPEDQLVVTDDRDE